MNRDPFSVLGLSSSATEDEIKSAYRKLAKKYHPDLNPGDKAAEEKMREINEAYTQALQYKRNGGHYSEPNSSPYGNNPYGSPYGNSYGNPFGSYYSYGPNGANGGRNGQDG